MYSAIIINNRIYNLCKTFAKMSAVFNKSKFNIPSGIQISSLDIVEFIQMV